MSGLYLDRCPACVSVACSPVRVVPSGAGVRADYVCDGCGHAWFTGWACVDGAS